MDFLLNELTRKYKTGAAERQAMTDMMFLLYSFLSSLELMKEGVMNKQLLKNIAPQRGMNIYLTEE